MMKRRDRAHDLRSAGGDSAARFDHRYRRRLPTSTAQVAAQSGAMVFQCNEGSKGGALKWLFAQDLRVSKTREVLTLSSTPIPL